MEIKDLVLEAASSLAKFFIDKPEWEKYLITVSFTGRTEPNDQYRLRNIKIQVHKIDHDEQKEEIKN